MAHLARLPFAALLLAALAPAQIPSAADAHKALPGDRGKGAATIQPKQIEGWLTTLTSPEFGGRGTGQDGFRLAAEYLRDHFQALGLEPGGDNGTYWQTVPWANSAVDVAQSHVTLKKGDQVVLKVPGERLAGMASNSVDATGEAVLLVLAPPTGERGRIEVAIPDDVDLAGKVVLVHVQQPDGAARARGTAQFAVLSALAGKNAAMVIGLEPDAVQGGITGRSGAGRGAGRAFAGARLAPASLSLGGDDLEALLDKAGIGKDQLAGKPMAMALPFTAQVQVPVKEVQLPAYNVIGILRGSDDKLKNEYVVIGSHLDHLGRRDDVYYPGADDDGSGSVGVMAVAQAFAKNPVRPRRSILFVAFCGEERGLVGSRYMADNPPVPLASMVAELQMDMIGRDEEENVEGNKGEKAEANRNTVHLIGTQKMSRDLHELCMQKNETAKLEIEWDQEGMFSRSDHASFAAKGVPIAFFFTGLHRDYHRPSDTVEKINFDKLARIATWVYDIGFELAVQDGRPLVDMDLWEKNRRSVRGVEVPAAPVRKKDGG